MAEYEVTQEEMSIAGGIKQEAATWGVVGDLGLRVAYPPDPDTHNDFWGFKEEIVKRVMVANNTPEPHSVEEELDDFIVSYFGNTYPNSFMAWRNPLKEITACVESFDRKALFRNGPNGMVDLFSPFTDAWLEEKELSVTQLLFDDLDLAQPFVEDTDPSLRKIMAGKYKVVLFASDRRRLGVSHTMNRFIDWGEEGIDLEGYALSTPGLRPGTRLIRVIGSFLPR